MRLRALFGLALCGAAQAAAVILEPGNAPELACPADALRTVRQAGAASDMAAAQAAASTGRAPFRMALWGDSHTATAAFTDAMLAGLRIDPQGTLPTFLPASWAVKGIAHPLRATCASAGWRTQLAHQGTRSVGPGLVSLAGEQAGSLLAFDFRWPQPATRITAVGLHLAKQSADRALVLGISADGGPEALVPLDGPVAEPLAIELRRPAATLQIRLVAGEVTVQGLAPVYAARPQAHLDVFSIPGATVEGWRHADVRGAAFAAGKPPLDLAILQYGTNEAPGAEQRPDDYAAVLRASLRTFRLAYPGARCVLVGPPDRGGPARTRDFSLVHFQVGRIQQQLAHEHRCEFWNWQSAMGGMRSAVAGAARTPPTVQPDLTHLTALGYRESGLAFGGWAAKPHR